MRHLRQALHRGARHQRARRAAVSPLQGHGHDPAAERLLRQDHQEELMFRQLREALERALAAMREEVALAERDLAEMTTQLQEAARRNPKLTSERSAEAGWQGLGEAGMDRPGTDLEGELLKGRMERAAREAEADAKLADLK